MINISSEALLELRRIRGERNINVTKLAEETGVSRWTLADILAGRRKFVRKSVYEKINAWILKNRKDSDLTVPDSLKALGGDIQQEPIGYEVKLYDLSGRGYYKQKFDSEAKADNAIAENVDELNEIAITLDTQQKEQVYKYD